MAFKKASEDPTKSAAIEALGDELGAVEVRIPNAVVVTDDHMRMIGREGGTGDAFADAMAIAEGLYGEVASFAEEMGNGFAILADKSVLIGKKCLFLMWRIHPGDYGDFASAAVVTADGGKYIVNDGSSGMGAQLIEMTMRTGKTGGYVANNGLRSSNYTTCGSCSKPRDSTTEVCENTLPNGSVCGDADIKRNIGTTYYVDLSA